MNEIKIKCVLIENFEEFGLKRNLIIMRNKHSKDFH